MEEYLVFGAGGQLGSAIERVFPAVRAYTKTDVDVTSESAVREALAYTTPRAIINAVSFCGVEEAEKDSFMAYRSHVLAPLILARAAASRGVPLVHVSTDYVFDGSKDSFTEDDVPNPLNVYGVSKLAGEHMVRAYAPLHYIIRTSALFGVRRDGTHQNFVSKRYAELRGGNTVSMVNDQWTVPTYTDDLAAALLALCERTVPSGTYHVVSSGGSVSWFDFTVTIAQSMGVDESHVVPINSSASSSMVRRPVHSVLASSRLASFDIVLPSWRDSLERYLKIL